jgi:hypothetical protein
MPTSTPGRRAASPTTARQRPPSNRATKASAKRIEQQETEELLNAETITVASDHHEDSTQDGSTARVEAVIQLIVELKETITQQSNIIKDQSNTIKDVRTELQEIKTEQRTLKVQNAELQEEIRSVRAQLDTFSASPPSTRSWASVVAGTNASQTATSLPSSASNDWPRKEPNCLRISTLASQQSAEATGENFARYLSTERANHYIQEALRKTDTTKDVKVAGVGTTKTGYVIRFKDEQSIAAAKANTEWLEKLGNDTKLVKPRFGVVVHRFPTDGITLPETKHDVINQIMEENEMQTRNYNINDIAWLKQSDKPLGVTASLGMWFDTAEAAGWAVANGLLYGQRYIGSVEVYQLKRKRCHRCQKFGHLAWSCKETMRCRHCSGEHDRRECPPGSEARCVDCSGAHPTGSRECNGATTANPQQ